MNIFLFVDKYLPTPLSCAKLIFDLASEIKSIGHVPFIFTMDETISNTKTIEKENGINVIRTLGKKTKTSNKLFRAYAEMTMSHKILKYNYDFINDTKCDFVIVYSPSIFWSKIIKRIKIINGCESYLILRDLFPQWLVDTGIINKNGIVNKYFLYKEKQLYDQCDTIGVQSPENLSYFNKLSLKNRYNLEVLYNWIKIRDDHQSYSVKKFRKSHNLINKTIFVYAGNIGFAQDLMNIVRLAENIINIKNIHFIIIGDGTEKEKIILEIAKRNLTNITLLSSVKEKILINILSECDVGLISLSKKLKTQNIPGKLLSYCQAGIPILASINKGKDLKNIIIDSNSGLIVENGNDDQLYISAIKLYENPEMIVEYGNNAKGLLKQYFDVRFAAKQILHHC